jgi:SsrA-binding protein
VANDSGRAKAVGGKRGSKQIVATNRKARHNYSVIELFEAGVALQGTEVKSLREGHASLADAFATIDDGEVWLRNLHIPEYDHDPRRNRKLLLHRQQIDRLVGKIRDGNLALVPLSLYFSEGKVKVELALARGKRAYDKRQDMARRDAQRELHRELGRRAKGMNGSGRLTPSCRPLRTASAILWAVWPLGGYPPCE